MKTTIKTLILGFVFALVATGCGKKKDNPVNSYPYGQYGAYQSNQNYTWNGQSCIQNQTGQPVSSTYCQTQGGQYPGGQYPGGMISKRCEGQYVYNGYGYPQPGTCSTNPQTGQNNCSGFQLLEVATNQMVMCQ